MRLYGGMPGQSAFPPGKDVVDIPCRDGLEDVSDPAARMLQGLDISAEACR